LLSIQDPYCKIYLGGQYQRSSTCHSGGKNPHWNDRFFFTIPYGTDPFLKVEVMDNDAIEDDVVGYGSYNIAQYLAQGMNTTSNHQITQLLSTSSTDEDTPEGSPSAWSSEEWPWVWAEWARWAAWAQWAAWARWEEWATEEEWALWEEEWATEEEWAPWEEEWAAAWAAGAQDGDLLHLSKQTIFYHFLQL
jgi:hypothetical protein